MKKQEQKNRKLARDEWIDRIESQESYEFFGSILIRALESKYEEVK